MTPYKWLGEQLGGPYSLRQKLGLLLGVLLFLIGVFLPPLGGLSLAAQRVAIVAILMAIWWVSEAISLYATALLPLVLFPLLNVLSIKEAAAPYGLSPYWRKGFSRQGSPPGRLSEARSSPSLIYLVVIPAFGL